MKLLELGKMTRYEKPVLGVFATTPIAWVTRGLVWGRFVPTVDDSAIAVAAIFLLFVLFHHRYQDLEVGRKQR